MWELCFGIFVVPVAILIALAIVEILLWGGGGDDS